jgi:hypothetical protein
MKKISVFLSVLFILSCASVDTEKSNPVSPNVNAAEKKNGKSGTLSMQEQEDAGRWFSGMQDGAFIIIGVSGRLTRAADEIPVAKEDAARKAAMYQGIQGSLISTSTSGAIFIDYSANSTLDLKYDTNYDQYMDRLSFDQDKDVIRGNGATYIRFKYDISGPGIVYNPVKSTGRPEWTYSRNLPQFPGYETVMGFARKRERMRNTIKASCDSAVAELIRTISSRLTVDLRSQTNSSSTSTSIYSEGSLVNFHVLEFWIDKDSGGVYTLAAARISQ